MKGKLSSIAAILLVLFSQSFSSAKGKESPGPGSQENLTSPQPAISMPTAQNKISLDIKGMDVIDVIKILATRSGMNVVVGKNVSGRVTLFLKDVNPWDAFEIILLSNDLAYEKKGDIINVMTQRDYELLYGDRYQSNQKLKVVHLQYAKASELATALNQIKTNIGRIVADEASSTLVLIDTPAAIKKMEGVIEKTDLPVETRVFRLNYAQADKLSPKIQEAITKGAGSVRIDERTNKIAVTDHPAKLDEIAKIVSAFDEKTPQVLIDAQIIEIKPSDKFEMGVDWDYWIKKYFDAKASLPLNVRGALFLGTASTTPTQKGQYKAIIDILRTIGDTKILSSPRIMALNNQEAKILVGTKDAYITSTTTQSGDSAVTSQSVNFVDVGIKLYVTPTINSDGFITMKIKPEISSAERTSITSEGKITQVPIVTTSESETAVMVKDGVTLIIGGLRKDERSKTVKKVPLLGDIPLVGFFLRSTSDEVKKTELVILLTPHIMSGESSYTDFSEINPVEGAVAKMVKGDIITEDISLSKQENVMNLAAAGNIISRDYYQMLVDRVNKCTKKNSPKNKKGEVKLNFSLSSNGNLVADPEVIKATDSSLIPFAIKAIKDASPFAAFPKSFEKTIETFYITIEYR